MVWIARTNIRLVFLLCFFIILIITIKLKQTKIFPIQKKATFYKASNVSFFILIRAGEREKKRSKNQSSVQMASVTTAATSSKLNSSSTATGENRRNGQENANEYLDEAVESVNRQIDVDIRAILDAFNALINLSSVRNNVLFGKKKEQEE